MTELIGQILGGVAVLLGFLSYQMKTQKQLLFMQTLTGAVFCVHYALIGAAVGMVLNLIGILRNLCYSYRNEKQIKALWMPILFAIIMGIAGIVTWEAWYSIFCLLGLVINTLCLSFASPQNVRKSILLTSPMVLIYDVFARSAGGVVYEAVAILSAAVGIVRMKKAEQADLPSTSKEET